MKTLRLLAMFVAMIVASAAPASAELLNFLVTLDGSQEVPANASPATGSATVLLDTTANTVTVSLSFSGLVAAQTNAHIHSPAAPGVNAPPTVPLPLGQLVNLVLPITDTIEGHIIAGLAYINVHSSTYPGGEIRGQLLAEPVSVEGSSWAGIKTLYR